MHSINEGARGEAAPRQLSGRGLSYWTDGKEERIIYVTPGYQMVALNAKTGDPVPGFGKNGIVDLKLEIDQQMDLVKGEVGLHAAPVIAKDVVIIGAAHLARHGAASRSPTRRATCAGTTCARASGSGSSTPSRGRASSATTRG